MKKLDHTSIENLAGGICQSFPGEANPGACFPQPCWAGIAFGLIFPTTNPTTDLACPA
ncbi:MAG TPA: hypothetical protein VFJ43_07750 [Bacteroidia bacterium]|nr:hypothetical protein [Bacteroidia bacterium]